MPRHSTFAVKGMSSFHGSSANLTGIQVGPLLGGTHAGFNNQRSASVKLNALPFLFRGGMAEPVVANGTHPARQNMEQVAFDELGSRKIKFLFSISLAPVFPTEGDGVLGHRQDASISNRGSAHVSSQVFDCILSCSEGLDLHAPIDAPNLGINFPPQHFVFFRKAWMTYPGQLR